MNSFSTRTLVMAGVWQAQMSHGTEVITTLPFELANTGLFASSRWRKP